MHVVYEFERDAEANSPACLSTHSSTTLPLNDLLDLCIKSMFKKTQLNTSIPGNLRCREDDPIYNKNVDSYMCLEEYPVDFC